MPRTLPLVFDDMIHELVELNILISRHQRVAIVLIDLAITEHIADLQQFADEFDARSLSDVRLSPSEKWKG